MYINLNVDKNKTSKTSKDTQVWQNHEVGCHKPNLIVPKYLECILRRRFPRSDTKSK